ncbi:MAG: CoA-binding protein [Actinomycetota bacterium]|nr:CoA-binding protein [Actinomycetota bacterium]
MDEPQDSTDEELHRILDDSRVAAVVGASARPERPSNGVIRYLLRNSRLRIFPVNPHHAEVLGMECYPSLHHVPERPDLVVVFRRPQFVREVVEDAVAKGADVIWMQLGIRNAVAAQTAREAGLDVVQDRCLAIEHRRLLGPQR